MIGYANIVEAVKKGFRVRAAVRRQDAVDKIRSGPSLRSYSEQLEFVIVEDITVGGAYDKAVKNVDHIIHTAGPLPLPVSITLRRGR